MQIDKIQSLDYASLRAILTSNKITDTQKSRFITRNKTEIAKIVQTEFHLTNTEFNALMNSRRLEKFKPIKNSFTKRGDKILLAKTLGIQPNEVNDYIKNVKDDMQDINRLGFLPKDKLDSIKTYVYRHGSKDDIITFLEYELTKTKDILKTLYTTLSYHTGGIADYFIRPIHRMNNKTMIQIYNVIDKNLKLAEKNGNISEQENSKIAKWALCQIYTIKNNNSFINAIKTYKILN